MNSAKYVLAAGLITMLWLAAVPAKADSLVAVDISNLTFQAAAGNNSCAGAPGSLAPCTETFNSTFEWDSTTNEVVPGTGVVNASGALPASDLPAANNWTIANNAAYPKIPGCAVPFASSFCLGVWLTTGYTGPDYVSLFDPNFVFTLIPGTYSYSGAQMACDAAPTDCDSLFDFTDGGGVHSPTPIAGTIIISPISNAPEPSTLVLFGAGLLGMLGAVRRKWLAKGSAVERTLPRLTQGLPPKYKPGA